MNKVLQRLREQYHDIPLATLRSAAQNIQQALDAKTTAGSLNYGIDSLFHSLEQYGRVKQRKMVKWLAVSGDLLAHIVNEDMFRQGGVQWKLVLEKLGAELGTEVNLQLDKCLYDIVEKIDTWLWERNE